MNEKYATAVCARELASGRVKYCGNLVLGAAQTSNIDDDPHSCCIPVYQSINQSIDNRLVDKMT